MKTLTVLCSFMIVLGAFAGTNSVVEGPSYELIRLIRLQEASGRLFAEGDKQLEYHAFGPLQIRQFVVDFCNERWHTDYTPEQCNGNLQLSLSMFREYVMYYASRIRLHRMPTDDDYARVWNAGPNGWRLSSSLIYVAKLNYLRIHGLSHSPSRKVVRKRKQNPTSR